jgi:hypothetical protein
MRTHVDWITFTMTMRYQSSYPETFSTADVYAKAMEDTWEENFDRELLAEAFGGSWMKNEFSRAPYVDAWQLPDRGITLFASPTLNHCCVEISGQGCETLIAKGLLNQVLQHVHSRVTRVDLASDIETQIKPSEFVEKRTHKRMQSDGYQNSKTGETCYIGSQKSDRYARVYRYNNPHPRAHLLRIEHVFRKAYAKKVAESILKDGIGNVVSAARDAFGWEHPVWEMGGDGGSDISIIKEKRATGKTVFWLVNSVAPAFRRLCEDGTISDPEAFIRAYFLEGK